MSWVTGSKPCHYQIISLFNVSAILSDNPAAEFALSVIGPRSRDIRFELVYLNKL